MLAWSFGIINSWQCKMTKFLTCLVLQKKKIKQVLAQINNF